MRQLPKRKSLPSATDWKLQEQTAAIRKTALAKRKATAKRLYDNARRRAWFKPVIDALREMSGKTERCMFCSGSESSNVEHFHPKALFPELALTWVNFLWVCMICNGAKGDAFPTLADERLINPLEENVWDFFRIDKKGNLAARRAPSLKAYHPRAVSTMRLVRLDRQALQESRQRHLLRLTQHVRDSVNLFQLGQLTQHDLSERVAVWREDAGQPDVADYFLNGPGRRKEPFAELFKLLT